MQLEQNRREQREEKIRGDIMNGDLKEDWQPFNYRQVTCLRCKGKGYTEHTNMYRLKWRIKCLCCMGKGTVEEIV